MDAIIKAVLMSVIGALLSFIGQRADAPTIVKDAEHDQPIEDAFDAEVNADAAAGRVDAPGAGV